LEPFSSAGPTPIIFDTAGSRLAIPQIRLKPEIVAPDGTDTTFFGRDVDADRFPNFFGTSAAAPHAAAVAALMLQSAPTTAPETVYDILETTAIDMAPPGFDFDSGFGLIQADQALATLGNGTPAVILYAGYLDNEHGSRNLAETPRPFDPDVRTLLISTGGVDTTHDTGVLRFENRTDAPVSIDPGLRVSIGKRVFQLWDSFLPISLLPGQNLVLAETANFNFDTSDFRLTRDPVVHGSVNGRQFSFTDNARILLGREEAGAKNINETTRYQIFGRIDAQVTTFAQTK